MAYYNDYITYNIMTISSMNQYQIYPKIRKCLGGLKATKNI